MGVISRLFQHKSFQFYTNPTVYPSVSYNPRYTHREEGRPYFFYEEVR